MSTFYFGRYCSSHVSVTLWHCCWCNYSMFPWDDMAVQWLALSPHSKCTGREASGGTRGCIVALLLHCDYIQLMYKKLSIVCVYLISHDQLLIRRITKEANLDGLYEVATRLAPGLISQNNRCFFFIVCWHRVNAEFNCVSMNWLKSLQPC